MTQELTHGDQCLVTLLLSLSTMSQLRVYKLRSPTEDNDWYPFLPECIPPKRYTLWWLLDRVRGMRLE
ncbi:hypothetical protein M432DRAFT_627814 [Thermoascus aurantiacus ATCC 26904]